mmetsp:Transcript_28320/g.45369  ORF Transcript_28320/g.45369 Transcript_28320/m.45369 type:complete len:302 (+) Transcript_28320:549-1454(+)
MISMHIAFVQVNIHHTTVVGPFLTGGFETLVIFVTLLDASVNVLAVAEVVMATGCDTIRLFVQTQSFCRPPYKPHRFHGAVHVRPGQHLITMGFEPLNDAGQLHGLPLVVALHPYPHPERRDVHFGDEREAPRVWPPLVGIDPGQYASAHPVAPHLPQLGDAETRELGDGMLYDVVRPVGVFLLEHVHQSYGEENLCRRPHSPRYTTWRHLALVGLWRCIRCHARPQYRTGGSSSSGISRSLDISDEFLASVLILRLAGYRVSRRNHARYCRLDERRHRSLALICGRLHRRCRRFRLGTGF